MVKRSELVKDIYVRMDPNLDPDNSYWQRLLAGRYVQIDKVAKEPDNAKAWGPCYGTVIYWSPNYMQQVFNDNMMLIPQAEQDRIKYIFKNKDEFKDLFKTARKIQRLMKRLGNILEDCGNGLDIWEFMDSEDVRVAIYDELGEDTDEDETEDIIEEALEVWDEIIELIGKLDELEEKHIRVWVNGESKTDNNAINPEEKNNDKTAINAY
jgi:hypothetical protein